jgi:hypothetical protein
VLEARQGELQIPDAAAKPPADGSKPMKAVPPRLPADNPPPVRGGRRAALAAWLTAKDNPFFARNAVNQVWAQLFGEGLVRSLDKLDATDGARRQVLDLLAADFAAHGHDLKRLIRTLVLSRAYQLGSAAPEGSREAGWTTGRFAVRPLSVDQLYQSVAWATGHRGDGGDDPAAQAEADAQANTDRPVAALGERARTVQRALVLLNGEYVHKAAQAGARAALTVHGPRVGPDHIEWLVLGTLSRRPSAEESAALLELARAGKGVRGLEDVLWVILNSAEFNSNH